MGQGEGEMLKFYLITKVLGWDIHPVNTDDLPCPNQLSQHFQR